MSIHVALNHVTHYRYYCPVKSESADRPPATRSALPNTHPGLFTAVQPRETFHQLAAGSRSQLSGAPGLPRQDDRVARRSGPGCGDLRIQPRSTFSRTIRGAFPVRGRGRASSASSRRTSKGHRPLPRFAERLASHTARARAHGRFSRCPKTVEWSRDIRYLICMQPGVDRRRDAGIERPALPRLRFAAGAAVASSWDCRPLRFRLPHSY